MNQIKSFLIDVLSGMPKKKAARVHCISKNTVKKYLTICETQTLTVSRLEQLDDQTFQAIFYAKELNSDEKKRADDFARRIPEILRNLGRVGVTRELLWKEYLVDFPKGYCYDRFCRKLKAHRLIQDATIRIEHKAGHRMMVDFSGSKMRWVDKRTGEVHECEVLVSTMPYSAITHAFAVPSQKQEDFVVAINEALLYFGGTPAILTSDNLKSYVSKASRYEPKFTDFCSQMGSFYGMELDATRVGKPKDKASVERHVGIVYSHLFAPLRDEIFHSIDAINAGLKQQLDLLNAKKMQGKSYSRREIFEQDEKPNLRPLPSALFEVNRSVLAKVQRNYHVEVGEDKHYYSVPFKHIGKRVQVVYTAKTVEIYAGIERIASHKRDRRPCAYTTLPIHMPEKHLKYKEQMGWDADFFKKKAQEIGPHTLWAIQMILEARTIVEQTYNSCKGVLRLSEKYGAERLEKAAHRASIGHRASYGILENILQNNLDKIEIIIEPELIIEPHENLRGPEYYAQLFLPFNKSL